MQKLRSFSAIEPGIISLELLTQMALSEGEENLPPSARPKMGKQGHFQLRDSREPAPELVSTSPITNMYKFWSALKDVEPGLQTKWKKGKHVNMPLQGKKNTIGS